MANDDIEIQRSSSPAPTLHDEPEMANIERLSSRAPALQTPIKMVTKILTGVMVAILVIFLADLSYLFGSTFRVNDRVSGLKILVVDYDGGAVGESVTNAYKMLQDKTFPTLEFRSADQYPETSDVKHGVCNADYWGAVYINKGSSDRLAAAYEGGSAAQDYNPADTITYIYNGARYPTVASGYIAPKIQALVGAARGGYYQTQEGRSALRNVNSSDPAAIEAYLNPITSTPDTIRPTNQGSRNLYNTINIVMAVLGQFFYVLAMNGIYDKFGIHKNMRVRDVYAMRFINGKIFSTLFAVVVTGYIWAFKEDWGVTGGQWALSWLTFWLFMDVNFVVLESVIGAYVPMALTPFPSHMVWSGCGNSLHIGLPILFAWWVVGHVIAFFGVRKRCMDAAQAEVSGNEKH
ncbi:hypothetical protein H9L39_19450 [Fusarium oxysporum f. sp. albedinis]|nr:hypothetical protein H9L39_19450 [Fusarium oxysporum f. sp. albedinis]